MDTTFSLAGQSLKLDDAPSIEPYIQNLKDSTLSKRITHLNLSGNTIGVGAAAALAEYLPNLTALESANLADIFTSRLLSEIPPALESLLQALLQCPKLSTINLSDNAFGLNTQTPLVKYLERAISLQHLILNNNGLGPEAGTHIANALIRLAEAKDAQNLLQTIVCGRNRLENGSASAWAKALAAHSSGLVEVRMSQNGIRVEGMTKILREGLGSATGLRILDFQDNLLTVQGAEALVASLRGWRHLKELQISDTLLSTKGGILVARALVENNHLEVLRCQYNEVNAQFLAIIVKHLHDNHLPSLRRVEVNGNKFSDEDPSVHALREVLEKRRNDADAEEDDNCGLDELDELESDEEEEDDDGDEEEDATESNAGDSQSAHEQESQDVGRGKDNDVETLAERLEKSL